MKSNESGAKRDEVTKEWKKFYSEALHILYSSPNIIRHTKSRRMRWAGHVAYTGEERKMYRVLEEKPEGTRPLGKPKHSWEDGIGMDLRENGWGDCRVDPVGSGYGSVVGSRKYSDEPVGSGAM
jgi:hypothetical protein